MQHRLIQLTKRSGLQPVYKVQYILYVKQVVDFSIHIFLKQNIYELKLNISSAPVLPLLRVLLVCLAQTGGVAIRWINKSSLKKY